MGKNEHKSEKHKSRKRKIIKRKEGKFKRVSEIYLVLPSFFLQIYKNNFIQLTLDIKQRFSFNLRDILAIITTNRFVKLLSMMRKGVGNREGENRY